MTWIKTVSYEQAQGRLRKLYDRIKGPDDNVDNIMLAHSLRPHTMEGHLTLYKHVLHHAANTVPLWLLETIGVLTSMLNACSYCVEHHAAGLARILEDEARVGTIRAALAARQWNTHFDQRESAALDYAARLTETPAAMTEADVESLRVAGWQDGEILELNQVVAYFNYANRTVLGLGIDTEGDILGLSPGDSSDSRDWRHQ